MQDEKEQKISQLAVQVLSLARDNVVVNLRFLDIAIAALSLQEEKGLNGMASDGEKLYYDPKWVLKTYEKEPQLVARTYLHCLLHLIFAHSFQSGKLDPETWNLAVDIAVESAILNMDFPAVQVKRDAEALDKLRVLEKALPNLTADEVYRYLRVNELSSSGKAEWTALFYKDRHNIWYASTEDAEEKMQRWMKISERVKTDLNTFSKSKSGAKTLETNLKEATKDRYRYEDVLRRFMVMGETVQVNDEEFDYIYYTYGLQTYGNMPLIEPLEYKDANKIKEFVIAIDTSASCKGEIVQGFLRKTYHILKSSETFFSQINVHIIQCDSEVRKDTKITNQKEFDAFCEKIELVGFGSTDFRPVFEYVRQLREEREFTNLKGLIYFTDGYGTYPEQMPDYDVMFAFLKEDEYAPKLPPWALKVVLDEEEFEKNE